MLLQPYNPNWISQFESVRVELNRPLSGIQVRIEHVGSTAVPELSAKPIIDIDLIYAAPDSWEAIRDGLQKCGYYHNGDQGIPGREVFKRNPFHNHTVLDAIPHHLYVCEEQSEEWKRHVLFRDYLRTHAEARLIYETLKHRIAVAAGQNRKQYALMKELEAKDFIEQCIREGFKNAS